MILDKIYQGANLDILKTFPDDFINCCVTSPPYYGLRNYGVEGQIGLESSIDAYINKLVEIFREVKRCLRPDGVLWLNLGDSYSTNKDDVLKLKPKDLIGIPWRVALALQSDGWYLRSDIIWHKNNPMPISVTDRCTTSHEYIFMLTKSSKYYYDNEVIKEPLQCKTKGVPFGGTNKQKEFVKDNATYSGNLYDSDKLSGRNKRSVWTINTQHYKGSHFAVFPEKLIEPCIMATCPRFVCPVCKKIRIATYDKEYIERPNGDELEEFNHKRGIAPGKGQARNRWSGGDIPIMPKTFKGFSDCSCGVEFVKGIVIDPFMGSGTTAIVAKKLNCNFIGIELNPEYIKLAEERINQTVATEHIKKENVIIKSIGDLI